MNHTDDIVEKVGHGFFLAKGFVEQFGHEESHGMTRHFVGTGGGQALGYAPVGGNLFKIVDRGFGVVVDHKVEVAERLEKVLLGTAAPFAYTLEDIGAHTQLTGEDFGYHRGLGVGCGVQHKGGSGECGNQKAKR